LLGLIREMPLTVKDAKKGAKSCEPFSWRALRDFFANFAVKCCRSGVEKQPFAKGTRLDGLVDTQLADDIGDIVFLEEANGGDAGGSGLEAGGCVF
jgi:hypothetical protein